MDLQESLGFFTDPDDPGRDREKVIQYINLKLAALGCPAFRDGADNGLLEIARPLLRSHHQMDRLLAGHLCPADRRIQDFLEDYLKDEPGPAFALPARTFLLDRHGLARELSLPPDQDSFVSGIISSYRVRQGILHNPKQDRRTTEGVFHVVEGGLPIPDDKIAVPKKAFRQMLALAFNPPDSLLRLPFTASQRNEAKLLVSLLLRPVVCPEVPGFISEKTLEIRFFAPGGLASNLDFVESIFGNAGDPSLPENDAALDAEHWTGHTGCVVLAPHLTSLRKKDLGLPHYDQASERQRRDGQCWRDPEELYNGGRAFKVTCRDARGVIFTAIADNYFGYCKKEVKTQISFSANLYGLCEEEHSGGALAFANYDLGEEFHLEGKWSKTNRTFAEVAALYGDLMELKPEGYGTDRRHPDIVYVPEDARFSLSQKSVTWTREGRSERIKLLASRTYVLPSGYKIRMKKQTGGRAWHLFGTVAEGTLCHKPSTVSGGGKSEISKSIVDAMIQGPIFTADFHKDFEAVDAILRREFGGQFKDKPDDAGARRPILSPSRSLGSVIKLLTPSSEYADAYNEWLQSIPPHIKEMLFVIKRFHRPEWGEDWRAHFNVDLVNGYPGHELKFDNRPLVANYLRVGREKDGSWRIYKVRQDFSAAEKLQVEDDITASVVVPSSRLGYLNPAYENPSVKLVHNCEHRLFQRPDDAIYRGMDRQAEADLAAPGSFLSNYEPLTRQDAREILEDAIGFDRFTEPMKDLIRDFVRTGQPSYLVSSAHPRLVDGAPSKNPRYLQNRPDLLNPRPKYLAEMGARFFRKVPLGQPVFWPVNAVLAGRRNNPPDAKAGIPPLAVYNPIHYQELPELFMDFICSLTGKSPSTTGFGSEGALTKGPFNALAPVIDLNNALVSFILTGYAGFTTAAGHIGPHFRIDHDISLLAPEIWCRLSPEERDPGFLVENGYLEKLADFEWQGRRIPASRLGYRITRRFARTFLGRIFNNPAAVFSEEMLQPEKQDMEMFVAGIESVAATHRKVARHYFNDGSVKDACPPLRALLHYMAEGHWEGLDVTHPDFRRMFTREYVLASDWYRQRLAVKQARDVNHGRRLIWAMEDFLNDGMGADAEARDAVRARLGRAREQADWVRSADYLERLKGTIGADPLGEAVSAIESGAGEAALRL